MVDVARLSIVCRRVIVYAPWHGHGAEPGFVGICAVLTCYSKGITGVVGRITGDLVEGAVKKCKELLGLGVVPGAQGFGRGKKRGIGGHGVVD